MNGFEFGNNLYRLRRERGISQKSLADALGVSDKAVSKWENARAMPQSATLSAVAVFFGVSVDMLIGNIREKPDGKSVLGSPFENAPLRREKVKARKSGMNLIPKTSKPCGDYVCTWSLQEDTAHKLGIVGTKCSDQRDALDDKTLFGEVNYYHHVPREYRSGLYLIIDDGWDVPYGTPNEKGQPFGSCDPDPEKWPYGDTAVERLKGLVKRAKGLGYAGLGIWVATRTYYEDEREVSFEEAREYWIERAKQSNEAGISYWKIDWGRHCDADYRTMMTEVLHKYAPGVIVEHAACQAPFSQMGDIESRKRNTAAILPVSDAFRLYDVAKPFEDSSMLCRADEALSAPHARKLGTTGILNGEVCAYVCAALGLASGIMYFGPNDEAMLRWHRIAPPFSIYANEYKKSDEILTDSMYFDRDPLWWIHVKGQYLEEKAPAVMARGCELPRVVPTGELKPFVCASKNPETGAYAIATIARTVDPNSDITALADIEFAVGGADALIGIFGYYASLTLKYSESLEGRRIYAEDLLSDVNAADAALDITDEVKIDGNTVTLGGRLLRRIGLSARSNSEPSVPSLVLTAR